MLSRNETIEQLLARAKPQESSTVPTSFSGPVTQVNIISHATINIESLQIIADGELNNIVEQAHHNDAKTTEKRPNSEPLPKRL